MNEDIELDDTETNGESAKLADLNSENYEPGKFQKGLSVATGFMCILFGDGFIYHLSVIFIELQREFGTSKAETAIVQSVASGTASIGGIFAGVMTATFGVHTTGVLGAALEFLGIAVSFFAPNILFLIVSLGFVTGLGASFTYIFGTTMAALNFKGSDRTLVLCITTVGGGVGSMTFGVLINYLSQEYGWRGALLILSAIISHLFIVNILSSRFQTSLRKVILPEAEQESVAKKLKHVLCDVYFTLHTIISSVAMAILLIMLIFHVDFFKSKGYVRSTAVFFYFIMALIGTAVRFLPGLMTKIFHIDAIYVQAGSIYIGAVGFGLLPLAKSYSMAMCMNCLIGVHLGFGISLYSVGPATILTAKHFTLGLGLLCTLNGILTISGGPLAGLVEDTTGSYDSLYYGVGVSLTICATFIVCITFIRNRYVRQRNKNTK